MVRAIPRIGCRLGWVLTVQVISAVIALPLQKDVVTVKNRAKCQAAVKIWDASRDDNLFDVHVYAEDTTMLGSFTDINFVLECLSTPSQSDCRV